MSKKKKRSTPEVREVDNIDNIKDKTLEKPDDTGLDDKEPENKKLEDTNPEDTALEDTSSDIAEGDPEGAEEPQKKAVRGERVKRAKRKINVRSLKHGSLSAAFTVIFIAAVALVNVIAAVLSERFGAAADLTGGSLYTLDEVTEKYLKERLASEVTITVLNSEQTFEQEQATRQVSEILKRMEIASANVKIEYLNLDQNPNYVSKFSGETLDTDYIVIEGKNTGRHRIVTPTDYFGLDTEEAAYYYYYYGYAAEYMIEQEVVGAMMYVTNENPVRVAFTEGFGESDYSALKDLLDKNGYSVETIDLLTAAEIDPDIDFVIVHAPKLDISSECLAKLDRFLDNSGGYGKNVLYFASVSQPKTPEIDSFLSDWSISVGFYDVGHTDTKYLISPLTPYAHRQKICDSAYTSGITGTSLYTLGADIRPVFVENNGLADVEVLMKTYDNAFLYPLDDITGDSFDMDTAQTGEFNDIAVSTKYASDGMPSRVFAIGSDQIFGSYLMSYSNANNSEFLVNLFDYVSGKEAGVVIKAKAPIDVTFEMTAKTANTYALVLCIIVPVCVIGAGIAVWIRRRHK